MKWNSAVAGLIALAASGLPAIAQTATTQPADAAATTSDAGSLEYRATKAFTDGRYDVAMPLLQQVADQNARQPDRQAYFQEMVRVCQKNLAAAPTTPAQPAMLASATTMPAPAPQAAGAPYDPNNPPLAANIRRVHPVPAPGQVQAMTIKELGNFEYDGEKGGNIPADVKAMTGSVVRLNGYMVPMDQADRITEFALVPSLTSCCYGQPPSVQHTIVVHTPTGKAISYFPDEIAVEGTLNVEEKKDDGFIVSVFDMVASSVKPAK